MDAQKYHCNFCCCPMMHEHPSNVLVEGVTLNVEWAGTVLVMKHVARANEGKYHLCLNCDAALRERFRREEKDS